MAEARSQIVGRSAGRASRAGKLEDKHLGLDRAYVCLGGLDLCCQRVHLAQRFRQAVGHKLTALVEVEYLVAQVRGRLTKFSLQACDMRLRTVYPHSAIGLKSRLTCASLHLVYQCHCSTLSVASVLASVARRYFLP